MKKFVLRAALAALVFLSAGGIAAAGDYLYFIRKDAGGRWDNGGNWFFQLTPGNFTGAHVPTSADDAEILAGNGQACDASGTSPQVMSLTVDALESVSGGNFDIGTLNFANPRAGNGSNGFTGSTINIRTIANFGLEFTFLTDCTFKVQGGAAVNQAHSIGVSGGDIFNQGAWVIQAGKALSYTGGTARFDNLGEVHGNGGTTAFDGVSFLTVNNSGTFTAEANSTLVINGNINWTAEDANHDGSFFAVDASSTIKIQGNFVVPANTTFYFKGPGSVQTTATVIVQGDLEIGVPASGPVSSSGFVRADTGLQPGNGVLAGTASAGGGGVYNINGGSVLDDTTATFNLDGLAKVTIKKNGKVRFKGPNANGNDFMNCNGGLWTNHGTIEIYLRSLTLMSTTFRNEVDGSINCFFPVGILSGGGSPTPSVTNLGVVNMLASTSQNPVPGLSLLFNNDGTLNVPGSTGLFQITGGQGGGVFNCGPDLSFVSNRYTFTGAPTFPGAGTILVKNGGNLFANDQVFVPFVRLGLETGGSLGGPGTFSVQDQFNFNAGTLQDGGRLETHGMSYYAGFELKVINGRTVVNSGVWTATGTGTVQSSNGMTFNNLPGAVFDAQNDFNWSSDGTGVFNNQGLFEKTAGTGTTSIAPNFNNNGMLSAFLGSIAFCNFVQSGGVTSLLGGTISMSCGMPMIVDGGNCNGSGTITGDFEIGTKVEKPHFGWGPGQSPGKLTINGNFTQGPAATLEIEVAGLATPGVDYDRVDVTGTAALGGGLHVTDINGFQPTANDTIVPLTANSITGKFDSTNAQVNYGSTSLTVAALPTNPAQLLNISTRMEVMTGSNVLIGGFILTGTDDKKVLVRGLGPSLPVTGPLADPTLELHDSSTTLATNDNWKDTQQPEIEATTIPPTNELESAVVRTLPANNAGYTAVLAGKNAATGIGLVEVYDLGQGANSKLANISTRGFVDTGDNVMIGGLILGPGGTGAAKVLVRAIGPSLSGSGVANPLQDPTLELRGSQGQLLSENDNWKDNQQAAIEATTIPPKADAEAAMVQTLVPGNYTAIVRGKNNTTGVALVELYNLPP